MAAIHKKLETLFARLAAVVYDRKYITLACVLLLSLALAGQLPKLRIDTRDETFFKDDDPVLVAYNRFRDTFGQDDRFIIAMKPRDGLTPGFIATLNQLHNELEASVPYIDRITSLINARTLRAEGDTLIVDDLMKDLPATDAELEHVMDIIDRYPLYDRLLISEDRSIVSILIRSRAVKEAPEEGLLEGFDRDAPPQPVAGGNYLSNDENIEIFTAINRVIEKYQGQGIDFYLAGTPAVVAELTRSIEDDLRRMVPLAFVLMVLFLFVLFRRISGVIYPLLVVSLSLVVTLGIMGMWGIPFTLVTQMLPTFLLVVGIGDSVHILTIFYRIYRSTGDKRGAVIQAMGYAGLPVLMTSLTTACGLLSFALADVGAVAQLGYVAPVGVMLALLYTVVMLPALIAVFPVKQGKPIPEGARPVADRVFDAISRITTRRPLSVAVVFALLTAAAVYGTVSVRFSHNALTWFPETSPVRTATEFLDKVNGGTVMLEAVVDSGRDNGLHDPGLLHRMDAAAPFIPGIRVHGIQAGKAWSLADVLKEINRALNEDRDDAYTVPQSRELIAQELLLFESSGSEDLQDFADSTYQTGRLSMLAPFTDAILYKDYMEEVETYLERQFPGESVTITGHLPMFVQVIKNTITSMAKSYVFAIIAITLLMVLMVGRIRIGLMSMIANVIPVIGILGLMGITGIPLDLSTILIGSIVLGLVVDDTIHFLHHFRRAYEDTGDVETSVRMTLHSTGRAMVITSLVLSSGFFIYTAAYLESTVRNGLLTGSAVIFALIADFFLVPAMLSLVYRRKR
ncbi:MAG: RND family transporter [Deferribacteres bacterium]|nr:RND family transporter [Deferribacteres bacterium]